jgi:glycosyltransferase involved in cell wall biosynthesis
MHHRPSNPDAMKSFTVSRKIPHHASHSGYDQLARYVGTPLNVPPFLYRIRGLGPFHRYFRKRSGMEWYDGLYAEFFTALHMRTHKPALYHFLFAENYFRYTARLQPYRKHKIISTFHTTPAEFERVMTQKEHLKSLHGAIVVSNYQFAMIEQIIGKGKVVYIPHGVDTHYFAPPNPKTVSSKTCLCVGHHHRDLMTLCKAAALIRNRDPEARVVLVDRVFSLYFSQDEQRVYRESFAAAGIELCVDLSDEELLRLYQTSALMLLPLHDTTANVAVLEALSCGLPIVVSDVGGIRDYVNTHAAVLVAQNDAEGMADQVIRLLQNPDERKDRSLAARNQALSFSWIVIADRIMEYYSQFAG